MQWIVTRYCTETYFVEAETREEALDAADRKESFNYKTLKITAKRIKEKKGKEEV